MSIDIYVSHDSDFDKLRKLALESYKGDKRILDDPKPVFRVREINPFSTKVRTNLWVKKHDYWDVLYDYNEKILTAFKNADTKFPSTNNSFVPKGD